MLNQVVIVGKIKEFVKINEDCQIKVLVQRPFKNEDGEYGSDLIPVMCHKTLADNVAQYCTEDDIIGVKGRIENIDGKIIVIADKITFLSSRTNKEEENNEQ